MRILLAAAATLIICQSALADLPEPLKSAVERPDSGPAYIFDVERTSVQTGETNETITAYARIDPSAPEFKQITPLHLIEADKPGSSFQALAEIERSLEDGIWCTRFAENLPDAEDIEIVAEDSQSVTYEFTPVPEEDASGPEKKIMKRTRAQIIVSKADPAILSYQRSLTKTVTLYVIAKIRKVDAQSTCARTPDGRTYTTHTSSAFEASGFGDGGNNSEMHITALYDPETGAPITNAP